MRKMLIADASEEQRIALRLAFENEYRVTSCSNGRAAVRLLEELRPDVLILDLRLPELDGIAVMHKAKAYLPVVTLVTTIAPTWYEEQTLQDLGVGHIIRKPCRIEAITLHVSEMLKFSHNRPSGQAGKVSEMLALLGVESHLGGYKQLQVGIPLYAQDKTQCICKELYESIAAICGKKNGSQIERTMRTAIRHAWEKRDDDVWALFFPRKNGTVPCPSNKAFIAELAERLA